jgi:ABC-2 type transport system permease protein
VTALALRQTGALAWRSVVTTLRIPQSWFPSLFFPLALLAIFTASFGDAPGNIPGFPPVRGFLDFAVAGSILQGVLIAGTGAGTAFAADMETGFFDRLVASPVSRWAILTGRLGASVVQGVIQGLLFLGIAVAFGARVHTGFGGIAVIALFAVLLAAAIGGIGVILAIRTGSGEAVQGTFPLFFILLFFSSAFFPRETMTGWYKAVADVNPISHIVEGMRSQVIGGEAGATLTGLAFAAGFAVLTVGLSALAYLRRLTTEGA